MKMGAAYAAQLAGGDGTCLARAALNPDRCPGWSTRCCSPHGTCFAQCVRPPVLRYDVRGSSGGAA